jgi:ABC-type amino acid transport substrate-binding protein
MELINYSNYNSIDKKESLINNNERISKEKNMELKQNIPNEFMKINKDIEKNKKYKVGLIIVPPYIIENTIPNIDSNNNIKKYTGLIYDIWDNIKTMNNLEVEEISLKPDYEIAIDMLNNNKIDILIGNLWIFEERARLALYSRPLFLSKIVIAYKPERSNINLYFDLLKKNYLLPLLIIFIIGIILGSILYYVEPERGRTRAIWTTMSSFLGEMGYLFENSKLKPLGMIVAFIIGILAFYYSLFLQATTTSEIIYEREAKELNIKNLKNKKFIMPSNFDIGNILQKYHINYDTIDIEPDKIANYYLQNIDKYDGYLSEYELIKQDLKDHPELVMTKQSYGFEENTFAVKDGNWDLINKINYSISILQKNDSIKHLCEKYLGDKDSNLCVL